MKTLRRPMLMLLAMMFMLLPIATSAYASGGDEASTFADEAYDYYDYLAYYFGEWW